MSLVMPSIASESHGLRENRDEQCYDLRLKNTARGATNNAIMFSLIETACSYEIATEKTLFYPHLSSIVDFTF